MDNINENKSEAANSNQASNDHLKLMQKVNLTRYKAQELITSTYDALDVLDEIIEDQRIAIISQTESTFCMESISEVAERGAKIREVYDEIVHISDTLDQSRMDEIETKNIEV